MLELGTSRLCFGRHVWVLPGGPCFRDCSLGVTSFLTVTSVFVSGGAFIQCGKVVRGCDRFGGYYFSNCEPSGFPFGLRGNDVSCRIFLGGLGAAVSTLVSSSYATFCANVTVNFSVVTTRTILRFGGRGDRVGLVTTIPFGRRRRGFPVG